MKFAATLLYEDAYALGAARFGLHDLIVRLVADDLPTAPFFRVVKALDGQPMKGVNRVLDALLNEPFKHAPNGRILVGCVDGDQLPRALAERKLADAAALKAASPLSAKVDIFNIGHNTEALVGSAASLIGCADSTLRAALGGKNRAARDLIFIELSRSPRRADFRAKNHGVDAVVTHLGPRVTAFLNAGAQP